MSQLLCFIFPIIVHKLLRNISYCIGVRNINIIRYSFVGCRRRCANSQCCLINIIVIISISIIVVVIIIIMFIIIIIMFIIIITTITSITSVTIITIITMCFLMAAQAQRRQSICCFWSEVTSLTYPGNIKSMSSM